MSQINQTLQPTEGLQKQRHHKWYMTPLLLFFFFYLAPLPFRIAGSHRLSRTARFIAFRISFFNFRLLCVSFLSILFNSSSLLPFTFVIGGFVVVPTLINLWFFRVWPILNRTGGRTCLFQSTHWYLKSPFFPQHYHTWVDWPHGWILWRGMRTQLPLIRQSTTTCSCSCVSTS